MPRPNFKRAVALRYNPEQDSAPVVVAKARGYLAEKILQLARQHQIPVRQDHNLVQILSTVELDKQIPPQAYQAVATILAFLYQIGRRGGGM